MPFLYAHPLLVNTFGAALLLTSMVGGPRIKVPGLSAAMVLIGCALVGVSAWWLYSSSPALCNGLYMAAGCYY